MTDAAHMLSDFAGFLISLFAIWVSRRPPSRGMTFGWHRAGGGRGGGGRNVEKEPGEGRGGGGGEGGSEEGWGEWWRRALR